MNKSMLIKIICVIMLLLTYGCSGKSGSTVVIDTKTATPGSTVTLHGATIQLSGSPLKVGDPLPSTVLIDAFTMKKVDLSQLKGKVLILSVVPSLDTKVCEIQTHRLGELGSRISGDITRITISRDTPFAQKRFSEESELSGITYLSDYRDGSFGRATGLLLEDSMLLARAVILADKEGIVRYIQVVPDLTHLPDFEKVLNRAGTLLTGKQSSYFSSWQYARLQDIAWPLQINV